MSERSILSSLRRHNRLTEEASDALYVAYTNLQKSESEYEIAVRDYTGFIKRVDIEIERAAEAQGYDPSLAVEEDGAMIDPDKDPEDMSKYTSNEAILDGVEKALKPKYEVQKSRLNSVKDRYARIYYAALGKFGGLIDALPDNKKRALDNTYEEAYRKYKDAQYTNSPTDTPITDAYHQEGSIDL